MRAGKNLKADLAFAILPFNLMQLDNKSFSFEGFIHVFLGILGIFSCLGLQPAF